VEKHRADALIVTWSWRAAKWNIVLSAISKSAIVQNAAIRFQIKWKNVPIAEWNYRNIQ